MVIFFCDASPIIGFGHLMRCRALASGLKEFGIDSVMLGPPTIYITSDDKKTFKKWEEIQEWKSSEYIANILIKNITNNLTDIIVLDDYRVDKILQVRLRDAKIKWAQFDIKIENDLWADWIINASPGVDAESYKGKLKNPKAKLLLGPKYGIIRSEFLGKKNNSVNVKKILLTFGGGNDHGATLLVLNSILDYLESEIKYVIISGMVNPHNQDINNFIKARGKGRIDFYIQPDNISSIFLSCDFAIIGGGITTFELLKCELPMAIISIASNQINQAKGWEKLGIAKYLGDINNLNRDKIKKDLVSLIQSSQFLKMKKIISQIDKPIGKELISKLLFKEF